MSDYENIVSNLMYQSDCLHMRNQYPNRVILGIEIVKILEAYCKYYLLEYKAANDVFFYLWDYQ